MDLDSLQRRGDGFEGALKLPGVWILSAKLEFFLKWSHVGLEGVHVLLVSCNQWFFMVIWTWWAYFWAGIMMEFKWNSELGESGRSPWLVVLEHFLFSHTLGMSSSQLTNIVQRGRSTTNQIHRLSIDYPYIIHKPYINQPESGISPVIQFWQGFVE